MLDSFTEGYLECLEFTECHCDNPELQSADGFSSELIANAIEICRDFQNSYADLLIIYEQATDNNMANAGHDLWLTRNRHGAGFWDRYYGKNPVYRNAMRELTDAAHAYGECCAYVGDDNLIYVE